MIIFQAKTAKLHIKFCSKRRNFFLRFTKRGHNNTVATNILTLGKQLLTTFLNSFAIIANFVNFTVAYHSIGQSFLGTDSENLYPNLSENLLPWSESGLYRIQCLENNKVYIGESINVLSRLEKHACALASNWSDVTQMQEDYNKFSKNSCSFHVILSGPEWACREKRLEKEIEIISSYLPEQVYNNHPSVERLERVNYRLIVEIDGQIYQSVAEAARTLNIPENSIRVRLKNNHPGYTIIDRVAQVYTPVIINDVEFNSVKSVVEAGLAPNRFVVLRRLNSTSNKWSSWKYKYGKKNSGPFESLEFIFLEESFFRTLFFKINFIDITNFRLKYTQYV